MTSHWRTDLPDPLFGLQFEIVFWQYYHGWLQPEASCPLCLLSWRQQEADSPRPAPPASTNYLIIPILVAILGPAGTHHIDCSLTQHWRAVRLQCLTFFTAGVLALSLFSIHPVLLDITSSQSLVTADF